MTDPAPAAPDLPINRPPTTAEVREWLGDGVLTGYTEPQIEVVVAAETASQADVCNVSPWTPDLTQALYRRVARHINATSVPLGILGADSDAGSAALPRYDVEIERLERPHRLVVIG